MYGQFLFECPCPPHVTYIKVLTCRFLGSIVGERYIATANVDSVAELPELDTHYLHLCNRYTRSWLFIKFPAVHAKIRKDHPRGECRFRLLGFFRPTVMLVLIRNPRVPRRPWSLELWQLSDDLESLEIVHKMSISREFLPTKDVQFNVEGNTMRVCFSGEMINAVGLQINTMRPQGIWIECTTSSSESTEQSAFEGDELNTYDNERFARFETVRSVMSKKMHHRDHCFMCEAPAGEVRCDVVTGELNEMEVRLLSMIPPKLSVLALRSVQKNMPEETAEKVALATKYIRDPASFVAFLLNNQHVRVE